MNHKLWLLCFPLCITACSNEIVEPIPPYSDQETLSNTKIRSVDEATNIAINAYFDFYGVNSRSNNINVSNVKTIVNKHSRSNASDTLLYVVNFENDNGFAIISAKNEIMPILAVVEKGNFDPQEKTDNPGFNMFLDHAICFSSGGGFVPDPPVTPEKRIEFKIECDTIEDSGSPLIKSQWGQEGFFAQECPLQKYAGCSAVAAAQILGWGVKPESFQLTYPNRKNDILNNLDWDKLVKHFKTDICTNSDNAHFTLSQIFRQIGYSIGAVYSENGTSAYFDDLHSYLNRFNEITVGPITEFNIGPNQLYNYYKEGIIVKRGQTASNSNFNKDKDEAHVWIEDGFRYKHISTKYYEREEGESMWQLKDITTTVELYVHINWGWNSDYNGYFNWTTAAPKNAAFYDSMTFNTSTKKPYCYECKFFSVKINQ